MRSPGNAWKPRIWPVSLSQNSAKMRKINKPWPWTNQFWRWSRYISMENFRPFPPCVLRQIPGNLSGRTDGRTCRKTVTVGRVDQRTHVQVKRGYFRLRTDGRTDGQPENIMPPAPKGGGITKTEMYNCSYVPTATKIRFHFHFPRSPDAAFGRHIGWMLNW